MDLIEEEDNELFQDGEILDLRNEDIQSNEENGAADEEKLSGDDEDKKPVKAKRIIRNPRAKLNAELLKGPKGLGNLEKCFERVQFKGKGHEEQNLNVMLKTYEYWCHRMFPKFPFKDCIAKIETLGSKGPIQTHLKKVRSGMIEDDAETLDILPDYKSDDEDNQPALSNSAQTTIQDTIDHTPTELTEEQLETIRINREKAEKLRQERLRKIKEKASLNLPDTNAISETKTCTEILRIEDNRENVLRDQSQLDLENENETSPGNSCDEEDSTKMNHNMIQESAQSRQTDNIESDIDELQTIKKCSKINFDDADEETNRPVKELELDSRNNDPDIDVVQGEENLNLSADGNDLEEQMEVDE